MNLTEIMSNSPIQISDVFPFNPYIALLTLLSFLIIPYKWLHTKKNALPSPPKLPLIGNLYQLGKLPHRNLRSLSQGYGDLMLLHLGSKPTLVVSAPSVAEEIMKTNDIVFANRPKSRVASIVLYNGKDVAFAKYGEYWRRIKSICVLHMLSNKKVQSFRKIREEEVALVVENINKTTPSRAVNLTEVHTRFTSDVACRVAFGRKYAGEEGVANMRELMDDFSEALGAFSIGDFVPWLGWIDHISGVLQKAHKVADALDGFIEKVIKEHQDLRNAGSENDEADKGDMDQDLVNVLLDIQRNDSSLERDIIKALLLDVFVAGTETTSTVLDWAMSELLSNPQKMSKLQEEVRGIAKGKSTINEDDLKDMNYLKAVVKETLRLHPSLPLLLFREASQDVKVNGHEILAGTQVIINGWAISRHPAFWDQPEEFRPERFLNSKVDLKGQDFEFIPFGAGRRGCPGMPFAVVKTELMLANLVCKFDWKLPADVDQQTFMTEVFGTSVRRHDPLLAIPTPHSLA